MSRDDTSQGALSTRQHPRPLCRSAHTAPEHESLTGALYTGQRALSDHKGSMLRYHWSLSAVARQRSLSAVLTGGNNILHLLSISSYPLNHTKFCIKTSNLENQAHTWGTAVEEPLVSIFVSHNMFKGAKCDLNFTARRRSAGLRATKTKLAKGYTPLFRSPPPRSPSAPPPLPACFQ